MRGGFISDMAIKAKGTILAILSAIFFGFNPLLARTVYADGGNAITLTLFRMLIGSVYMSILHVMIAKESMYVTRAEFGRLLICSTGYAATPLLLLSSYNFLPSGLCTTAHFVYPVLVIVSCIMLKMEKASVKKICCGILCLMGILCFYSPTGEVNLTGLLLSLGSGATYAFYIVYISFSGLLDMKQYKMTAWLNIISTGIVAIFAILTRQIAMPQNAMGWGVMVAFAIAAGMASIMFQLGNKYVGAQSASLLSTFEPLTSVLVGVLVYKEIMTGRSAFGILFILTAVILLSVGKNKSEA